MVKWTIGGGEVDRFRSPAWPRSPLRRRVPIGPALFEFGSRTYVMGVLNVTPDSFSDGGLYFDVEKACRRAWQMVEEGVDIIDVGAASASFRARPVSPEEEIERLRPVLERLAAELPVPLSVDTHRASVARVALEAGAHIINDISGLRADPELPDVIAEFGAAVVIMHMLGTPAQPERNPRYTDVIAEVRADLLAGAERAERAGIPPEKIIVDPGIGVAKGTEHNLEILQRLPELASLDFPLLVGASRTSVIGNILELPVNDRLEGTLAVTAVGAAMGVDVVRVHDVRANVRVARMADAMVRGVPVPEDGWPFDAISGDMLRPLRPVGGPAGAAGNGEPGTKGACGEGGAP